MIIKIVYVSKIYSRQLITFLIMLILMIYANIIFKK